MLAPFPDALPLYEAARAVIEAIGPVEIEATRTQIAFRAKRRFAFLWVPALALRRGPPDLYLTIDLPRRLDSPRFKEIAEPSRGHHVHHMLLARKRDLDAEARGWLREAYEHAMRPARPAPRPGPAGAGRRARPPRRRPS